jgi:SH3-like domain-containing protein
VKGTAFLIGTAFLFLSTVGQSVFAAGDPACVKNPATLRKGPGANFPVSWKVAKFMPVLKMESKNGWVKVQDLEGEQHWIQPRELTTGIRCVVVKSNIATLRKDPSTTAGTADLKTIDRYTPLKRLESQGEWMHVEDEAGHQAWIHESTVWKPTKIQTVNF